MKITKKDLRNLIRESLDEVYGRELALGGAPASGQTGKSSTDYDIEHLKDVLDTLNSKMRVPSMPFETVKKLEAAHEIVREVLISLGWNPKKK